MRIYGADSKDYGCCPGHNKWGATSKETGRPRQKRRDRGRKKKARQQHKKIIKHNLYE